MLQAATIQRFAQAFEMTYCHPKYCSCGGDEQGEHAYLLFLNTHWSEPHDLLPRWANGSDPEALYTWVQKQAWKNSRLAAFLRERGLILYRRFSDA